MTPKVILNSNQAKVIANAIYKDILSYVQTHQKEYEEFLKSTQFCIFCRICLRLHYRKFRGDICS